VSDTFGPWYVHYLFLQSLFPSFAFSSRLAIRLSSSRHVPFPRPFMPGISPPGFSRPPLCFGHTPQPISPCVVRVTWPLPPLLPLFSLRSYLTGPAGLAFLLTTSRPYPYLILLPTLHAAVFTPAFFRRCHICARSYPRKLAVCLFPQQKLLVSLFTFRCRFFRLHGPIFRVATLLWPFPLRRFQGSISVSFPFTCWQS